MNCSLIRGENMQHQNLQLQSRCLLCQRLHHLSPNAQTPEATLDYYAYDTVMFLSARWLDSAFAIFHSSSIM
jgi:hypothetical protein